MNDDDICRFETCDDTGPHLCQVLCQVGSFMLMIQFLFLARKTGHENEDPVATTQLPVCLVLYSASLERTSLASKSSLLAYATANPFSNCILTSDQLIDKILSTPKIDRHAKIQNKTEHHLFRMGSILGFLGSLSHNMCAIPNTCGRTGSRGCP
jgi:hypothetical protein